MSSYSSIILADTPIRYYRLNERSGTSVADLGSQGQNGTITGAVTLGATGLLANDGDGSYLWDGTTEYITCPSAGISSGSFSLEAWVRLTGLGSVGANLYGTIFGLSSTARLLYNTSTGKFLTQQGGTYLSTGSYALSRVHHVVLVWNGTSESFWVDGIQDSTFAASPAPTWTGAFLVGINSDIANYAFVGNIDEIAIYNYALSSTQITTHYTTGSIWRIDDGSFNLTESTTVTPSLSLSETTTTNEILTLTPSMTLSEMTSLVESWTRLSSFSITETSSITEQTLLQIYQAITEQSSISETVKFFHDSHLVLRTRNGTATLKVREA